MPAGFGGRLQTLEAISHAKAAGVPIVVAINKIGSLLNGPLLALFLIAAFAPAVGEGAALRGLAAGMALNAALWLGAPGVSWLWWNVFGFVTTVVVGLLVSSLRRQARPSEDLVWSLSGLTSLGFDGAWRIRYLTLGIWFLLLTSTLLTI